MKADIVVLIIKLFIHYILLLFVEACIYIYLLNFAYFYVKFTDNFMNYVLTNARAVVSGCHLIPPSQSHIYTSANVLLLYKRPSFTPLKYSGKIIVSRNY